MEEEFKEKKTIVPVKALFRLSKHFKTKVCALSWIGIPWYIRDADLQKDMGIDLGRTVIFKHATAHKLRHNEASKLVEEVNADR